MIVVRMKEDDSYEVIQGHQRLNLHLGLYGQAIARVLGQEDSITIREVDGRLMGYSSMAETASIAEKEHLHALLARLFDNPASVVRSVASDDDLRRAITTATKLTRERT